MCPLCIAATALLVSGGLSAGGIAALPLAKVWRKRDTTPRPLCPAGALSTQAGTGRAAGK